MRSRWNTRTAILSTLVWVSGWAMATSPTTDTLEELQKRVLANQHEQAFQLAEQHIESIGEPGFDFYYGIAAIESGHPSVGVFALERYITVYPDNRTARFYLARGYFILGEDQLARAEFEDLLRDADPSESAVILQYLDGIWERENRYFPRFRFVAELGLGHDSNVNEGVGAGPVSGLPGINVDVNSSNRRVSDSVVMSSVAIDGSRPLAPGLTWLGHVKADMYGPLDKTQFDHRQLAAGTGLAWESGRQLWRTGIEFRNQWIDSQRLLGNSTWFADWHYRPDQFQRWGAAVSWSDLNYRDVNLFNTLDRSGGRVATNDGQRDSEILQISANHTRYFSHPWAPAWKNTLLLGQERNQQGVANLSRDFWGLQTAWTARPADRWLMQFQLAYLNSSHKAPYGVGLATRQDDRWQASAAVSYRWSRRWQLVTEWSLMEQNSNIGLHDFGRQRWSIKARYEIK